VDDLDAIRRQNKALADRINQEALADPASPYAGKVVGIANGQVAVVDADWQTVHRRLLELEPDHRRRCWFEASRDYSKPSYV
jgi:hypothetical protein